MPIIMIMPCTNVSGLAMRNDEGNSLFKAIL